MVLRSIDSSSHYWIRLLKNGDLEFSMDYHGTSIDPASFHNIDSSAFVHSNGTDYFEFNGFSMIDVDFSIDLNALNQLTIEYVV